MLFPAFLFFTAALQLTDNQVLPLLLPRLREETWVGAPTSWLLPVYAIGAAMGPLLLTRCFPGFRGRRAVLAGLALLGGTQAALALIPSFEVAVGLRIVAGAGSGILSYALLIEAVAHGGLAVGGMTAGFLLAYVAGIPSGPRLVEAFGISGLYWVLAGLALALGIVASILVPGRPASSNAASPGLEPSSFMTFLRDQQLRAGIVTSVLVGAALAGPVAAFPSALQAKTAAHLSLSDVSDVYYLAGIGPLIALPMVRPCITRFGGQVIARWGALALILPILSMPLAMHSKWGAAGLLLAALVVETLRRTALQNLVGKLAEDAHRPRYLALRNVAVQVAIAGGIALTFFIVSAFGWKVACGFGAAMALASSFWIPASAVRTE